MYIQLAKESIEYKIVSGKHRTTATQRITRQKNEIRYYL